MQLQNIDPKKYYILAYSWHQYAIGITGINRNYLVYTNTKKGYDDRKEAAKRVSLIKKERKEKNKYAEKNVGYGSVGAVGGSEFITRGDKLEVNFNKKFGSNHYDPGTISSVTEID